MAGGAYVGLSGLKVRFDQLDRMAADIANGSTIGYKGERSTTTASERPTFDDALQSAIDVTRGPRGFDWRTGNVLPTHRDLDAAVEGRGFFVVQTPQGPRYTRNGHFDRQLDGTLTTTEGYPVLGADAQPLELGKGPVTIEQDGTVRTGTVVAGRLSIVDFSDYSLLMRDQGAYFQTTGDAKPTPVAKPAVRSGALEESNVSVVDRLAQLVELTRGFETLQRGISMLSNDIDARAISELGRR